MVNSKEEVNILELYGKECLLTKEDFIKENSQLEITFIKNEINK